jgi:hypothetical protein
MYLLKHTKSLLKNKHGKSPADVCRSEKIKEILLKNGLSVKKSEKSDKK